MPAPARGAGDAIRTGAVTARWASIEQFANDSQSTCHASGDIAMQQKRFAYRSHSKSTHSATAARHFVTRNNAMNGDDQLAK